MAQIERKILKPSKFKQFINSTFGWLIPMNRERMTLWSVGGRSDVTPDINADKAITEGFDTNAAVYSIVMKDVRKFSSIPRYVIDVNKIDKAKRFNYKVKAYNRDAIVNNKLSDLLNRPNPYQGQDAFLKTVRGFYKICGESFIWLNRGDNMDARGNLIPDAQMDLKEVEEMYALPSNKVDLVPDPENLWGCIGYLLNVAGKRLFLRKNDVIHWRDVNLDWDATTRVHLRGMPPLRPGAMSLQMNIDASKSAVRMYQNDGARGVLSSKNIGDITPTQESEIRAVVDRKINNNDIKGAIATIMGVGELSYINFGGTALDMQLLDGRRLSWEELCYLFDVPYELFQSATTFANKEQAKKNWLNDSIIPASKEFDDELNRVLLKAFKLTGKYRIQCDYTELPELQDNMKELTDWLNNSPEITPNEKRIAKGYEPYSDPLLDEPWMPSGSQPISQVEDSISQMVDQLTASGANDYQNMPPPDTQSNGKANGKSHIKYYDVIK